jgi:hypothetical protein
LHQVQRRGRSRSRAAGDEAAAGLQHQKRAVERIRADMLENDVDALLLGDLPDLVLEAVVTVVDKVIRAERPGPFQLGVFAGGRDDRATDCLGHLDRDAADAGAARMNQNGFARLQLRVVKEHVLDGAEGDRRASRIARADARRDRDHQPFRHVHQFAPKTVDMKAEDAADVFAEIVAAIATSGAGATGQCAVHHDRLAGLETSDSRADARDFS